MPIKNNTRKSAGPNPESLASDFFVNEVESNSRSSSLHLGHPTRDLLDCINLFAKELFFKEVTKMSITIGSLVQIQKTLIHSLFQFQSCFQSIKRGSPFHGTGLSNVLEDDLSASLVLILEQLLPMLPLLVGGLLEEGRHAGVSHIVPVEV